MKIAKEKKILSWILAVVCMISMLMVPVHVHAEEQELPTGDLLPIEAVEIDESYGELDASEQAVYSNGDDSTLFSAVNRSDWDRYGDTYCYENMNEEWQSIYDAMAAMCERYMNTRADITKLMVNGKAVYGIGPFSHDNMSKEDLSALVYIFNYQNPEYYFLANGLYYNSKVVYIKVYDTFADGDSRSDMSSEIFRIVDGWAQEVAAQTTEYKKMKKACDIVCDNVSYDQTGVSDIFNQSLYSAVMTQKSVCAGYAKLYSAITNAGGLRTVSVTSKSHAWNRTKLGDRWYNVDMTWGDTGLYRYAYMAKSDATMMAYDGTSKESHTPHDYYDTLAPSCPVDYNSVKTVVEADAISLENPSIVLDLASNPVATIRTVFSPADVTDQSLSYVSGDIRVATVDANGTVTAVGAGKTQITVRKRTNNLKAVCTVEVRAPEKQADITVSYRTHVQTYGWQSAVTNGRLSGTNAEGKRLEGIMITVSGDADLGIQYTTHCQTYGWLPWASNGDLSGTEAEGKRLEAIKIRLTGADRDKYDVFYRVHAQTYGWLGWAKNGAPAGSGGYAKRLEGIQIVVLPKGSTAPGLDYAGVNATAYVHRSEMYIALPGLAPVLNQNSTDSQNPQIPGEDQCNILTRTHVQTYGWQGWRYNGQMSGTSGEAKRLEGICIKLTNKPYSGSVVYTTHVQTYGWQENPDNPDTWRRDGRMSGTSGEAKRLEGICIALTGEMAQHYDVYYRVHAQSYGWLGWARNGAPAGTSGLAKRLEGIQVVLVEKGSAAPAMNYGGIRSENRFSYIRR